MLCLQKTQNKQTRQTKQMHSKIRPRRLQGRVGAQGAALLALGSVTDPATAGGSYVPMKGAIASGLANVGMAPLAEDGSTVFYNPAGMTRLGVAVAEVGAEVGADVINADLSIANRGSSAHGLGAGSASVQTLGPEGHSSGWTLVPNLFAGASLSGGDVWLGLAITAPFGLQVKYAPDWFGRYDSYDNELTTVNVAPTLAYRFNDAWSIGAVRNTSIPTAI
jgi:long-chain fatty acid transport protein